ncbi:hypothetical protein BS78_01G121800 [Paspalum vaginatum]|nr:hypothetical protein BS78_01G121800 [Paspalum vaginatum]
MALTFPAKRLLKWMRQVGIKERVAGPNARGFGLLIGAWIVGLIAGSCWIIESVCFVALLAWGLGGRRQTGVASERLLAWLRRVSSAECESLEPGLAGHKLRRGSLAHGNTQSGADPFGTTPFHSLPCPSRKVMGRTIRLA